MIFRSDSRKAVEASAILLRLAHEKTMSRKRLLALLYHAERESLLRTGRPIIGGKLVAMDHGPIHSEVYDFIKGGHRDQARWSKHFNNEGYNVVLGEDPGVSGLSRYEINLLNEISEQYMACDDWDVAMKSHYSEHEKFHKKGTSTPIPLEELIDAIGRSADKDKILKDAAEKNYLDRLFAQQ